MELEIGAIFEGKVTGITKFGAFVALPGGRSGLVHISEVAWTYVSDVSEYLSVGESVQVKVISVDENNRINLSIKQTTPAPERQERPSGRKSEGRSSVRRSREGRPGAERRDGRAQGNSRSTASSREPASFDDMLKRFMSESESKNARLNRGERSRRRGNGRGN